ncbi:mechanosensitive ion channel family protein [Methylibium rhizosphaerae]|jgi:small-conductance mechanosensitive channel|uniref:mechanosensitive ion channel family protein n=1 Tax=Methylibium rhizosphaerae TaxID=2570323 RepID=UPI0015E33A4B|nr:mechanosensitive ion channel domain-containing protein [Methylibium rhizosphaerae]
MDWQFLRDELQRFDIHLFTLGGASFTLWSFVKLVIALIVLFYMAAWLNRWAVRKVLQHANVDAGLRQSIGSMVHYLVLIIGIALILQNAGIKLTAFAVVAGAVSVGIGFGLQNIISNFISGLIVMFERPIKVGDRIEVAGVEGTVHEIGARRTTIITNDSIAILVPNQKFITDNVVNLVYMDYQIRLRVPVHVAGGSDIALVRRLLLEAAHEHPDVVKQPEPAVLLLSLGGAAMNFELTVWFSAENRLRQEVLSELNFAVGEKLRAHEVKNA